MANSIVRRTTIVGIVISKLVNGCVGTVFNWITQTTCVTTDVSRQMYGSFPHQPVPSHPSKLSKHAVRAGGG